MSRLLTSVSFGSFPSHSCLFISGYWFFLPCLHPLSLLPFPHILTCLFHYLLIISLCLYPLLSPPPSLCPPPPSFPSLDAASCLVTFSSSTWLCRQEKPTLSELRQAKPNADRASKPVLLIIDGKGRGGAIKCSHSYEHRLEAFPPCWDKTVVINAMII